MHLPGIKVAVITPPRKNSWLVWTLALLGLTLLVWADLNFIVPLKELDLPNYGNDMSYFWTAARTVWQGGNPYLAEPGSIYQTVRLAAGGDPQMLDPFKSPYYLTLLFMPLASLPLGAAASLWTALMQLALGSSIVMIIRLAKRRIKPVLLLSGIGLALLWRYTFLVMLVGQLSLVLLFCIVASYYFSRAGRPYLAGVLAGGLLVKPQIIFLVLPLLLVVPTICKQTGRISWLNRATGWRWAGFASLAAVFGAYSFALSPGWVAEWLKTVLGSDTSYLYSRTVDAEVSSLRSLLAWLAPDKNLVLPLLLVISAPLWLGLGGLWWRHRNRPQSFPFVLAGAIAINLLTTPYIRDYDSALLLFGLLLAYFSLRQYEAGQPNLLEAVRSVDGLAQTVKSKPNQQPTEEYSTNPKPAVVRLPDSRSLYNFRWSWLAWPLALLPFGVRFASLDNGTAAFEAVVPLAVILYLYIACRKTTTKGDNQISNSTRPA